MKSCLVWQEPSWLSYSVCTCVIVIGVLNLVGNGLVCIAVLKDPLKNLKTPFNYFLTNLSFSDLLIGCVTLPIFVYRRLVEHHSPSSRSVNTVWSSEDKYVYASYFLSTSASTLSVITLVMDRYIAIRWPIYYRLKISMKRSILMSMLIWLISIILMFGYFATGFTGDYLLIFTTIQVLATIIVLSFAYIAVHHQLSERQFLSRAAACRIKSKGQAQKANNDPKHPQTPPTRNRLEPISPRENMRRESVTSYSDRQNRVIFSFFVLMMAFLICGVPACVLIYILRFCLRCTCTVRQALHDVTLLLVLCTSAMNPFILALRLASFKSALRRIFCPLFTARYDDHSPNAIHVLSPTIVMRKYTVNTSTSQLDFNNSNNSNKNNNSNKTNNNKNNKNSNNDNNSNNKFNSNEFYKSKSNKSISTDSLCTISIKVDISNVL